MKDIETALRTCAADPADAMRIYDQTWQKLIDVAEDDITKAVPVLKEIAGEISRIPLARRMEDCPKVLIVGEIYVRRDDFAVDELIQQLSGHGIIGKVSNVAEWFYYCDFVRHHELKKKLSLIPWHRRLFSPESREIIHWNIEHAYKHHVEKTVREALSKTGLLPRAPHNMKQIMKNAEGHFVSRELYSEISISSGVAATAMMDGYSGIVNISPFACLIGRVIEGLFTPWARERRYPAISIEIDGNLLPPNVLHRMEIFMLNVKRFKGSEPIDALVERDGAAPSAIDRKMIRQ
jgi:predicted nucleotide-binding protein (sugar kinase/HSP70/actin superfamily)